MTDNYPITPPPELVKQWWKEAQRADYSDGLPCWLNYVATQAARWGANQELEACCGWLSDELAAYLRDRRRTKPPSLKEQALAKLAAMERLWEAAGNEPSDIVRRALEQLDD